MLFAVTGASGQEKTAAYLSCAGCYQVAHRGNTYD
jgi:hypothetical protein